MKVIDVDLALKINRLVHNECKDVPHDIGMRIVELINCHNFQQLPSEEKHKNKKKNKKKERKCIICGEKIDFLDENNCCVDCSEY